MKIPPVTESIVVETDYMFYGQVAAWIKSLLLKAPQPNAFLALT